MPTGYGETTSVAGDPGAAPNNSPTRKPWAKPRVIVAEARHAAGGTSPTTIDFVHAPGTYFAS